MYKILARAFMFFIAILGYGTQLEAQTPACLTCLPNGVQLVTNGNFSQGNNGFSSSYGFFNQNPPPDMAEGLYSVVANPTSIHSGFAGCPDHTTGTGNQMVINGATVTNVTLWCQTITVNPNTDYLFSTWVQSLVSGNPAVLQFSINGVNLGNTFSPPLAICQWSEFFTVWNSGSSTTASICIVNQNTSFGGNDFSLDDISFIECVPIVPLSASVIYDDAGCFGENSGSATPNTGQAWNGVPPYTYVWFDGTSDAVKDSLAPGNYFLVVTDSVNCVDTVFFTISEAPQFLVDLGADTTSCFGQPYTLQNLSPQQPPGITYAWNTGETTTSITADSSGQYILCATLNACTVCDTVNIVISPDFTVNIGPPDTMFCMGGSINLIADTIIGAQYLWNTGDTTQLLYVDSSGLYWVMVSLDSLCSRYDSIYVGQSICTSVMFVPNVFTPNGDGFNDSFIPAIGGIVTDVTVHIFNRWGLEVYKSDNGATFSWDGKINGGPDATESVYYWILTYKDNNGMVKELSGTVALFRN